MDKERLKIGLMSRGVSKEHLQKVGEFCHVSKKYVFPKEHTIEDGLAMISSKLKPLVSPQELAVVEEKTKALLSQAPPELKYAEEGYDSCQANRETSKVISSLLCMGGVYFEGKNLLGIDLSPEDIKSILGLNIELTKEELDILGKVADKLGNQQDFLFPGVTASNENTPDLEMFALSSLAGKPQVTVRNIVGVGGVRLDKEWNMVTTFWNFAKAKVEEDRRYYKGLGILYFLVNVPREEIPALCQLRSQDHVSYSLLTAEIERLKGEDKTVKDCSILCSAYMPPAYELKGAREADLVIDSKINDFLAMLNQAFHSPAYVFAHFYKIGEILGKLSGGELGAKDASEIITQQTIQVKKWAKGLWTFNSTIHLPWASSSSYLAHDLIGGKVTNQRGEWSIRYGVGTEKGAFETRLYGLGARMAIQKLLYKDPLFINLSSGDNWIWGSKNPFIETVIENGFFTVALDELEGVKDGATEV